MLIFVPIILLLLLAVLINILGRYKYSIGSAWLITAASVLVVWISVILFRGLMPEGVSISNWSFIETGTDLLIYKLSARTWIYAFLLVTLLVAVIFTDTVRLDQGNHLTTWTGSMVLVAVGLLSIFSQTFLAVILSWMVIDFVELAILIKVSENSKTHDAIIIEFTTRMIGTVLVICAFVLSGYQFSLADNPSYSKGIYLLILFGVTLRLGILPLHVPLTINLRIRRSLGTILRFVAPISVISFLIQIQPQLQFSEIIKFFFAASMIIALYGAIAWINAKDELTGRAYWMLAFLGLVMACFVKGQVESMISMSMLMILSGGFIFLHSIKTRINLFIGVFGLLGMIGFLFTPTAALWPGIQSTNGFIGTGLFTLTMGLMLYGFLKQIIRDREIERAKEMWMKFFYLIGLGILSVSPWITLIWGFKEIRNVHYWLLPLVCVLLVVWLFTYHLIKPRLRIRAKLPLTKMNDIFIQAAGYIGLFFKFDWFFWLVRKIFDWVSQPIRFFNNLLEGDGGLLWSFLFLAFIASVLITETLP